MRKSPDTRGGHTDDGQAQDGESGGGHEGARGGADHEDQFGGDGVQGEGGAPLLAVGQHAEGLADHAEDGQRQQAADEDQRQQHS